MREAREGMTKRSPRFLRRSEPGQVPRVSLNRGWLSRSCPDTPGARGTDTSVMRMFLLLSFLLAATPAFTQTPATPPPSGQTPTPAPAQPRPRPAQPRQTPRPPTGRAGIALTVTDMSGVPLPNI